MTTPEITGQGPEKMQPDSSPASLPIQGRDSRIHADEALDAVMSKANQKDDDEESIAQNWSPKRRTAARLLNSKVCEFTLGSFVLIDLALMMIKVDRRAVCTGKGGLPSADSSRCAANAPDMVIPEYLILGLYTIDSFVRLCVFRGFFHKDLWNVADLLIVVVSWLQTVVSSAGSQIRYLKLFRVLRAAKIFKLLSEFRELYLLISGFAATVKVVFWASLLLFVMLSMVSVVAVEIVHPINLQAMDHGKCQNERCERAFSSVWQSNLSFFQTIILGDSWGAVSTPVIEEEPLLAPFFVGLALIIFLGYGNLVVGVIVEQAMEAREQDKQFQIDQKRAEELETKLELLEICREIDADASGTLTKEELMSMCSDAKVAKAMEHLGLKEKDLHVAFDCMDADKSGYISYTEFVEQLFDMKYADLTMLLTFVRHDMQQSSSKLLEKVDKVSTVMDNQLLLIQALTKTCSQLWTNTEELMKARSSDPKACDSTSVTETAQQTNAYENEQSKVLPTSPISGPKPSSARSEPSSRSPSWSVTVSRASSTNHSQPQQPKDFNEDMVVPVEEVPNNQIALSPGLTALPDNPWPATMDPQKQEVSATQICDAAFEERFMDLSMKVEEKLSFITADLLSCIADETRAVCHSAEMLVQLDTSLSRILSHDGLSKASRGQRRVPAIKASAAASAVGATASQCAQSSTRSNVPRGSSARLSARGTGMQCAQESTDGAQIASSFCNACGPAPPVMRV